MATEFVDAWRKRDAKLETDATAIWQKLDLLPPTVNVNDRLKELALLAYEDGQAVGVSTLNIMHYEPVKQKFAFVRGVVLPEYRRTYVAQRLLAATYQMIEAYSIAHPEEAIAGTMAVVQGRDLGKFGGGGPSRMTLIGYTNIDDQVRMRWFDHFQVPTVTGVSRPE